MQLEIKEATDLVEGKQKVKILCLKVRFKIKKWNDYRERYDEVWSRWYYENELEEIKGLIASAVEVQEIITKDLER